MPKNTMIAILNALKDELMREAGWAAGDGDSYREAMYRAEAHGVDLAIKRLLEKW